MTSFFLFPITLLVATLSDAYWQYTPTRCPASDPTRNHFRAHRVGLGRGG